MPGTIVETPGLAPASPVSEAPPVIAPTEPSPPPPAETKEEAKEGVPGAPPADAPDDPVAKFKKELDAKMQAQRVDWRKHQEQQQQQQMLSLAQQVEQAKKFGPEAVLKVLGLDSPKKETRQKAEFDLDEILGEPKAKEPGWAKELRQEVAELRAARQRDEDARAQWQQQQQQQQQQTALQEYQRNMMGSIDEHLAKNPDKFENLNALSQNFERSGIVRQVYDLIVDAYYNHGANLSIDQAAEILENYSDTQREVLNKTKKASAVKSGAKPTPSGKTLTNSMLADTSQPVDEWKETDAQNKARALAEARAVWEAQKKQMQTP